MINRKLCTQATLIAIMLLAFFWRIWQLPHLPPGLWYDEAYYSMDAAWLLDGGPWRLFFAGNNGREPLFIYLQAPLIWLFGAAPLTSRLIGPLAGTLTVPLVYVLARRLIDDFVREGNSLQGEAKQDLYVMSPALRFVPYLAMAGLAFSYWHISLSRTGFRVVLLPLVAAFVFYTFWRGWQENSFKWFTLAGLGLGISQYTYLAARLLPLGFAVFALVYTLLNWRSLSFFARRSGRPSQGKPPVSGLPRLTSLWFGLLLMAGLSAIIFAPLGWLFYQNPALFSARTGDVLFNPHTPTELFQQLFSALRLFIDGGDPGWRHNFQSRPMLGWLGWLGFWPGLFICWHYRRRPSGLFLLTALLTIFLPALFAVPPIHALRLSALLPIYFIIFALGLVAVAGLGLKVKHSTFKSQPATRFVAFILVSVMVIEGCLTGYDYFYRWAGAEGTYIEYNGPLVDFINEIIPQTNGTAVIIPFQLYLHPTARYLLHDHFVERPAPAGLSGPAKFVTLPDAFRMLNVGNLPAMPSLVWLTRDSTGQGVAYVSRPPRPDEQSFLDAQVAALKPYIYRDRLGRELAHLRLLTDPSPLYPMFTDPSPQRSIAVTWADQVQLIGYDVIPPVARPGQPLTLNLYWHSLTDQTFDYRLFLQLINAAGQPINQWEGESFREDAYRWRPNSILSTQVTLWLGPDTPPGPYLVRLGFFDDQTGQRLPILTPPSGETVDQIQLGLFYVSPAGTDPRQPTTSLSATFGDSIKLIGAALPPQSEIVNSKAKIEVIFNWQALHPTGKPYTVFLQLLNDQGQVVSSWDGQPLNGLYPTNLWSPGETITDTFNLPLPEAGLPPGHYRLITGFYEVATGQRLPVDTGGDFAELTQFTLQ